VSAILTAPCQSHLAVKNLCLAVDLHAKLEVLLGQLQNVQVSRQYRETSIYAQDKKNQVGSLLAAQLLLSYSHQMFVRLTESFATLNVLSTDPTNPELHKIQLSLDEYHGMVSNDPTMLQFTTEDGNFWSFDKTRYTVESLLCEWEGLIRGALSQQYSPAFVIRKLRRLSTVLQLLELQEASIAAGECAIELAREQAKRYLDLREELVVTLTTIARLREGDFNIARALYQEAINTRKKPFPLVDPSLSSQTVLGDLLYEAAETALLNCCPHDACIWFEEAIAVRQQVFKEAPTYENGYNLAKSLNWKAVSISRVSPTDPLVPQTFQRAITTSRQLVAAFTDKDHIALVHFLHNLGETYIRSNHPDLAIPPMEEALVLQRAALDQSDTSTIRSLLALILEDLAVAYARTGGPAKALPLAEECLELRRDLRRSHPDMQRYHTARVLGVLSEVLRGVGRDDEAMEMLVEAIFIFRQENVSGLPLPIKQMLIRISDDLGSLLASRNTPLEDWTLVFESMLLWEAL
jgi:tetratricopeptide (TPR) repeat protein